MCSFDPFSPAQSHIYVQTFCRNFSYQNIKNVCRKFVNHNNYKNCLITDIHNYYPILYSTNYINTTNHYYTYVCIIYYTSS